VGTIYQSIEILSKEKGIDPQIVIDAVKDAMLVAARKHFRSVEDLVAEFNAQGALEIYAVKTVADPVADPVREISLHDAKKVDPAAELGAVDVLLNCAGIVHQGTILECTQRDWDYSFDLNGTSIYRTCRAFLPAMIAAGRGSIINISSVASSIKGVPNRFVYSATKAAVIGLTKSIATDFVGKGIRCNAICPGTVQSPSLKERVAAQGDYEKAYAAFVARQPMGRLGRVEEVAASAVYLASDESALTTGQIHVIDGGWTG
jgi:2-keto-3-deoxy-L-fuconate dehydrogenase